MPIFDFKCQECGHKFDLMISNADKDKAQCPQCGTTNLQQLLSSFSTSRLGVAADACFGCGSAGTGG
ncbi:MAG: zinc ribbon domain-containing protein [Syntrophomonas sp.]|jgi:putative FmdB family regulatory protein|nr:zinc ribbon domain-containing protein [Syntrophomonas sp.]